MSLTERPLGIPAKYFYPYLIFFLVLSIVGAFIFPDSNFIGLALIICFGFFLMFLNYLGRLTGIGSRIRTQNLLKLAAELIKIDGVIDTKEKRIALDSFLSDFPKLLAKKRAKKFEQYLNQDNDLKPVFAILKKYPNRFKIELIRDLVRIAISDKYLSEKEDKFLKVTTKRIGFSIKLLESILALHFFVDEKEQKKGNYKSKKINYSFKNAFNILGVDSSSSMDEVRKAYRELAKIYHPDKVRNPRMKEAAKVQFQAITQAYELIKEKKR